MNNNRLLCGNAVSTPDIRYFSGFSAEDDFIWFQTDKLTAVVVNQLEVGRANKQCRPGVTVIDSGKVREFFNLPTLSEKERNLSPLARIVKSIAEGTGATIWEVNEKFPLALAFELEKMGIEVKVAVPFAPEREVKTPGEIEKIRNAQRLAEAGLARADVILGEAVIGKDRMLYWNGELLTADMLRGEIDAAIVRKGGLPRGTIAAPGPQGADPHQCGTGPIAANVPIVMDIFPCDQKSGYYGDLTRTRVKGNASAEVLRTYQTVLEAQQMILDTLKCGVEASSYHIAVEDFFKNAGYETGFDKNAQAYFGFFHGLGHSLGLEIHESPHLNLSDHRPLRPGYILTVEPGLYYPSWGGIRIEDTVALTENGVDNLTVAPKFLEIP